MNGRPSAFRISGHPVAQFLSMILIGVVLVGAVIMGAVAFLVLLGLFAVGYSIFWLRAWWGWRRLRGGAPVERPSDSGPPAGVPYIEGEFEVVEADADATHRPSGTR